MKISINGIQTEININTLQELTDKQTHAMFAIALNGKFIPRSEYKTIYLNEDDDIEIITAMPGG